MNWIGKSLLSKCMVLLMGLTMATTGFSVLPAAALTHDEYPWLYEDYETNDIEQRVAAQDITLGGATAKWVAGGVGGTKGAVNVVVSQNHGYMRHKINMVKGQEYKLSAWIKMKNTTLKDNTAHFILFFPAESDGVELYTDLVTANAGLNNDAWVKIETTYTHDGKGNRAGADRRDEALPEGTIEIRLGNGVPASATEEGRFDFLVDDFIVEPIVEAPVTEEKPDDPADSANLLGDGSFDSGFNSSQWKIDSGLTVTYQAGGANGTAGCIRLDNAGISFGALLKTIPHFMFNRAYKISFYAKAEDGVTESDGTVTDTTGKRIRIIVDNSSGRTHAAVQNFNYLTFENTLTTEWQKFETIFYQSAPTYESAETIKTSIFPRVGTEGLWGDEGREKVHYYLDEYTIEELPLPYNGDFSAPLSEGWQAVGADAELSDDIPADSNAVKSAHINTTADYGYLSQVLPIKREQNYELSFWAKGVNWDGKASDSDTVPFSVILDRSAGESFRAKYKFDGPSFETITQGKDGGLTLSTQWQKYTVLYRVNFSATNDCTPTLYWRIGADGATGSGAEYYLADIVLTEVADTEEPYNKPQAKNLAVEGDPVVGEPLRIKYTYEGITAEGRSLVRILKNINGKENGWVTVRSGFAEHEAFDGYVVDPICLNQPMKVEVFAIDAKGTPGPVSVLEIGEAKADFVVQPSFSSAWGAETVTGQVHLESNRPGGEKKSILMILSLYDEKNMMCAQTEKSEVLASGDKKDVTIAIPMTGNACTARLFVWEGTNSLHTSMTAFTDVIELKAQ